MYHMLKRGPLAKDYLENFPNFWSQPKKKFRTITTVPTKCLNCNYDVYHPARCSRTVKVGPSTHPASSTLVTLRTLSPAGCLEW